MSKSNRGNTSAAKIKMICMAAVFCALAFASTFVFHFKVMFLTFDIKDSIVTIAGLLFGPLYSLSISVIVALLEFISQGETGPWGFLMDILSTATFSTICAVIYKYKKNIKGAIIGLVTSVLAMTAIMLLFNIFITPIYMGVSRGEVIALIPTLFLPFNLVKAVFNSAIAMMLYKPTSKALRAAKVLPTKDIDTRLSAQNAAEKRKKDIIFSLIVTIVSIVIIVCCIFIFIFFMNGKFEFI